MARPALRGPAVEESAALVARVKTIPVRSLARRWVIQAATARRDKTVPSAPPAWPQAVWDRSSVTNGFRLRRAREEAVVTAVVAVVVVVAAVTPDCSATMVVAMEQEEEEAAVVEGAVHRAGKGGERRSASCS
jgi:hypothetical protein